MQQSKNHLVLKKAHVPLSTILKLSTKNIWKKKFRFLIVLIICAISLTFLSFTIELNGDKLRQNVYTMVENGYQYTDIKSHVPVSDKLLKENYYNKFNSGDLEDGAYENIKKAVGGLTLHKYYDVSIDYCGAGKENAYMFYPGQIDTLIIYDKSNTYNLLSGRLPNEDKKEILITDYLASAFTYFNILPNCKLASDYIGMHLDLNTWDNYEIVGILDTNYEKWLKFANPQITSIDESNKENYSFLNDLKIINSICLPEKYFNDERLSVKDSLKITTLSNDPSKWSVYNPDSELKYQANTVYLKKTGVSIMKVRLYGDSFALGRAPKNADEIVIPYTFISNLFTYNDREQVEFTKLDNWYKLHFFNNFIENSTITFKIEKTVDNKTIIYEKDFKIVGIADDSINAQIHNDELINLVEKFTPRKDTIIVELPNNPEQALKYFNEAYSAGYVINVWEYRTDIDNYEVDPFIDILSKGGLFVFVIFTMGIMWTIISIEIVDSKKEIGIMRSIGLSGTQVSLIFILQMLFINLISYLLAIFASSKIIPIYNSGITDELGKVVLYMYNFTYRTPLFLLIFVLFMTFTATIIPLYKIMSQKIISVITEKDETSPKKKKKFH